MKSCVVNINQKHPCLTTVISAAFVFRMSLCLPSCRLKVTSECQLLSEHNSSVDNVDTMPTLQNFLYTG